MSGGPDPGRHPLFSKIKASKVKDAVLFVGGLIGMVYEAAQVNPRPVLVGAYLLGLGLGVFFPVDRVFQRPTPPPPEQTAPSQTPGEPT